jgi:hypothetical protein
MKVRKLVLRLVLGVVILLVVLVVAAGLMINGIAKAGIEKGGTYALGVDTRVQSVNLGLLRGRLVLDGLNVANPEGFDTKHLMHTGRFDVELKPASLFGKTVELNHFVLDGLDVNVEQKLGGSNVSKLLDNLKRFESPQDQAKQKQPSGKKVAINRILVKDVKAHFTLISGAPVTVVIPEMELTDVTSDQPGGVMVSRLVARLVPAILAGVVQQAQGLVPADLLNGLNGQLGGLAQAMGGQAGKLIQQAQTELGKSLGVDAEKVGGQVKESLPKGVTDLLGGLKKPASQPAR